MICPICNTSTFQDFRGRKNAQCRNCKSLERTRLLWLVMEDGLALRPGMRVLHIAPEPSLIEKFVELAGSLYHAADYSPERYKNKRSQIFKFDMCEDVFRFPSSSFDLIVHNHVLEHIKCDYWSVVSELNRLLIPGGQHLFSVPFRGPKTHEDLSDVLSDEERTHRFGQHDHMRLFGTEDFPQKLKSLDSRWQAPVDVSNFCTEEDLANYSIPKTVYKKINGSSVFRLIAD